MCAESAYSGIDSGEAATIVKRKTLNLILDEIINVKMLLITNKIVLKDLLALLLEIV